MRREVGIERWGWKRGEAAGGREGNTREAGKWWEQYSEEWGWEMSGGSQKRWGKMNSWVRRFFPGVKFLVVRRCLGKKMFRDTDKRKYMWSRASWACAQFFYIVFQGSPIYTVFGVINFLKWPKNETMQILIGPAWSRNAGPAALACGAYRVLQVRVGEGGLKFWHWLMQNYFTWTLNSDVYKQLIGSFRDEKYGEISKVLATSEFFRSKSLFLGSESGFSFLFARTNSRGEKFLFSRLIQYIVAIISDILCCYERRTAERSVLWKAIH